MAAQRLSALDAGFLALETDDVPLHIGALVVLEGPPPHADEFRVDLARRASLVPWCRQRVRMRRAALRRPVWVDDVAFDARRHLHGVRLPPGADRDALCRLVSELMASRLDTSQPLWEAWEIAGAPGGTWAVLVTAHHTLLDGVSGAGLLSDLLSAADVPVHTDSSIPVSARAPLLERARRLRRGLRTVAVPDLPPSVLNGPLGPSRTWGWCDVDLAVLEVLADQHACTVNDVYLAALTGSVKAALLEGGELGPDTRVRTLVPVSTRSAVGAAHARNLVAAFFVDLPVHAETVGDMLDEIAARTARAKADKVPLDTEQLLRAGDAVPALVLDRAARAYARRGQRRVNLVASNVRGPTAPMRLCGRRVTAIVPVVPLALQVRLTSALMTYDGSAAVSITVDRSTGTDAESFVAAFERALDELANPHR